VIGGVFGDHTHMTIARVLVLGGAAALGACHGDAGPAAQATATTHAGMRAAPKKGPDAAELTAGMVDSASMGKSQLPVELKFNLQQRPTLGQPLDIDIAILPQIDAGPADIDVAGDGLTMAAGAGHVELAAVEAGQVYRQSFKVTPAADGVLLLSLTVTLKHDEMSESRAFSIPLIVGH
jgi:hypothetical protein